MKKKGLPYYKIITVIIVATIALIVFFDSKKDTTFESKLLEYKPKTLATPTISKVSPFEGMSFVERQFDTNTTSASQIDYPPSVADIPIDDLIKMRCTPSYNVYQYPYADKIIDSNSQNKELTDVKLLDVIDQLNKNIQLSAITFCEVEDGRTIILSESHSGNGGSNNKVDISVLQNGSIDFIHTFQNFGVAYFNCSALQLAKNNMLFLSCGGGDGASSSSRIYSTNLATKEIETLISCQSIQGKSECK